MIVAMMVALLMLGLLGSPAASPEPLRVLIDPGHHPEQPGAMGASGEMEVTYNDRLARALLERLRGITLVEAHLSRQPHENLGLAARLERSSRLGAHLLLSLHHDSVKPKYIEYRDDRPRCTLFSGYSIFAQGQGPHHRASLTLAQLIGDRYQGAGRRPTRYHALPIPGEDRIWLDRHRGIHAGDHLYLLREARQPVLLVESGFLVHPAEERDLASVATVSALAEALALALLDFARNHRPLWAAEGAASGASETQPPAP